MSSSFTVHCKGLGGGVVDVEVYSGTRIIFIKQVISQSIEAHPDAQRLIFAGRQLEDEKTLGDYGIVSENIIHLVLRTRGD